MYSKREEDSFSLSGKNSLPNSNSSVGFPDDESFDSSKGSSLNYANKIKRPLPMAVFKRLLVNHSRWLLLSISFAVLGSLLLRPIRTIGELKMMYRIRVQNQQIARQLPFDLVFAQGGDYTAGLIGTGPLPRRGGMLLDDNRAIERKDGGLLVEYSDNYFRLDDEAGLERIEESLEEVELPRCERTILIDWGSFADGLGSTYFAILQAGLFASRHNFTLLISQDVNNYGRYLDFFAPPPMNCKPTEEMLSIDCQDTINCREITDAFDPIERGELITLPHFFMHHRDVLPLNYHLSRNYFWENSEFSTLPTLSSQRALPFSAAVPTVMLDHFKAMALQSEIYFQQNHQLAARTSSIKSKLKSILKQDDIAIGVLYRGGDKLSIECSATERISCGNITLHAEAAYQSYLSVLHNRQEDKRIRRRKPKLILMTIEPGIHREFERDPIGRMFEIVDMPSDEVSDSFDQQKFNRQSMSDRVESTRSMLASIEVLSLYVDGFIVSANSNLGRLAMIRGGIKRLTQGVKVRPFDLYFYPTSWKVVYPECDGTEKCQV